MSEFDEIANHLALDRGRRLLAMRAVLWTLYPFEAGEDITIDLLGESIDITEPIKIGDDQTIAGRLVRPKQAEIVVDRATHQPQLVGKHIILAADTYLGTPAGVSVALTLPYGVRPFAPMAYFEPRDVRPDAPYGLPDSFQHIAARYARVKVGAVEYFNTRTDPLL